MKVVATLLALLTVSLAAQAQDDERTRRILERIERELTESRAKLRAEIRDIIRAEIERARTTPKPKSKPKAAPSKKPDVIDEIQAFAGHLKNDGGLNSRLSRFLRTEKGAVFVKQQLIESAEFETFEQARDAYCVKGRDGKYVVREEHVEAVREMLDQAAPAAAPKKKGKVRLGIVAEDFAPGERKKLGIAGGIKIVDVRDPARAAGLKGGDVLVEISGKPVTEETILRILEQYGPGDVVKVTVMRNRERRTFPLKLLGVRE